MEGTKEEKVTLKPQEVIKQLKAENEELKHQLGTVIQSANEKMKELYNVNLFKRIDYLFKVIENPVCFEQTFVDQCAKEIQQFITIPEEEKVEENKNKEE